MQIMTEEEADALDELLTKTTPKVNPAIKGITGQKGFKMIPVDNFSVEYITSKAIATRSIKRYEIIRKSSILGHLLQ